MLHSLPDLLGTGKVHLGVVGKLLTCTVLLDDEPGDGDEKPDSSEETDDVGVRAVVVFDCVSYRLRDTEGDGNASCGTDGRDGLENVADLGSLNRVQLGVLIEGLGTVDDRLLGFDHDWKIADDHGESGDIEGVGNVVKNGS